VRERERERERKRELDVKGETRGNLESESAAQRKRTTAGNQGSDRRPSTPMSNMPTTSPFLVKKILP
jgi:hypothetical protein